MKKRLKILVPVLIVLTFNFIGCESNPLKTSNGKSENVSQTKTDDLLKYKDSYAGDNSAVGNITAMLPANAYNAGFSLQTSKKPYGMTINYKANKNSGEENYNDFWSSKKPEELLEKNAVVLLSLIPNADTVKFNVDNIGKKSYEYDRKDLEQKYGGELKTLFKDAASYEKFLNNH